MLQEIIHAPCAGFFLPRVEYHKGDIQLFAGGNAVPRYDSAWSGNALTIRLDDPLEPDDTLTISYSCRRTGTLGYKTQLTDRSIADVTAAGTQTDVEV